MACLALPFMGYGERYIGESSGTKSSAASTKSMAAGCLPGQAFTYLSVNNVNTRINTGGDMFWDLRGNAQYEIPKGSGKMSLFASALWLGGQDVNGQLKVAAQRFRASGVDFWTGPLTVDGTAAIDPETCNQYDKHFPITRAEVEAHIAWTLDPNAYPDYVIPRSILEWPAHGDITKGQSYYLAPFFDFTGSGTYEPELGDYPYYDFGNELCRSNTPTAEGNGILADQVIKGDQTLWWVFNDKGNIHQETNASPIGFEIRAQAFGFSTNDEVNNMTFLSYEIINRSTYTLTETYFSQWIDADLGYAWDDYIGCDVVRGLGYCYNGKDVDGIGQPEAYGNQPPAIGVDFFQGPYMDPDGMDNPMFDESGALVCGVNINGVNFADGIIDNERFGMRRFVYHNNGGAAYMTDPSRGVDYYNLLRGIWKDGTKMVYGGNGHASAGGYGPEADFMFPNETDPCNWGTGGLPPNGPKKWTEQTAGNPPSDRRFMHSAGPFTLKPGAVNYITVGIPWARAASGGAYASVALMKLADDKAQALFDNCFKILDGPDAPDLVIQELDRELILYVTNRPTSNNYLEKYEELDFSILEKYTKTFPPVYEFDSITGQYNQILVPDTIINFDRFYRFQGYKIYQVRDASVSVSDLRDADKARLVFQCDIKDDVVKLVNFKMDEATGFSMPVLEVDGANQGIRHSFRVTEDQFARGDKRLINHKQYYFMAIAYAFNEYHPYDATGDDLDKLGQKNPYLAGRKAAVGPIESVVAIPQRPIPGTVINAKYGDQPVITRLEGYGNGGFGVELSDETVANILKEPYFTKELTYKKNSGPVGIFVTDPLNVKAGDYTFRLLPPDTINPVNIRNSNWVITETSSGKEYPSYKSILVNNEQILFDLGISVSVVQPGRVGNNIAENNGFISASMSYADSSKMYLFGVPDDDGLGASLNPDFNWIRSGTLKDPENVNSSFPDLDPNNVYSRILGGIWAPYKLVSFYAPSTVDPENPRPIGAVPGFARSDFQAVNRWELLPGVDVVITPDKSKWTRCPVVETGRYPTLSQGGKAFWDLRGAPSVDKEGKPAPAGAEASTDPNNPAFISATGMGWFPGYAIDVETGTRLNLFFGEDSWLNGENGRDMLWNPTAKVANSLGHPVFGGKHFLYVMMNNHDGRTPAQGGPTELCPPYDHGAWVYDKLLTASTQSRRLLAQEIGWVTIPLGDPDTWLSNEVKIRLRVNRPYSRFLGANRRAPGAENMDYPYYKFSLTDMAVTRNNVDLAKDQLADIKVVPNPYLGFSEYETTQLDNRVKIINLPERCTVSIYTMNGTLIRQLTKDEPYTALEWDMKNSANIPIASGVYIIHVKADGIGETVLKWFCTIRPTDLKAF